MIIIIILVIVIIISTACWGIVDPCALGKPLTPRVKPGGATFDSMDSILKCDHSLESCGAVLYCGAVWFSILPSL